MGQYILVIIVLSNLGLIATSGALWIVMTWRANDLLPENPKGAPNDVAWGMIREYARLRPHSVLPRLANIVFGLASGSPLSVP